MRRLIALILLALGACGAWAAEGPQFVHPPYDPPKVVYDFYLEQPQQIGAALGWLQGLIKPLSEPPYSFTPEMMNIKVVLHGAELATVVKSNYARYKSAVERMRYYAALGVQFKVCSLAAGSYGYQVSDFQDFIDVVPSAQTELVYWQMQGYAVITPRVFSRSAR